MSEIVNTTPGDLEEIYGFFEHSIQYQEKNGYPVWRNYDKKALVQDIVDKNQYKVIIDSRIGIVFSVRYSDKVIWRHLDDGSAIYLHRIVVNPEFKGRKLFGRILEWVIDHSKQKGINHIRMDTWASNPTIIDYYKKFGFSVIENYTTPDSEELPVHNRKLALTLLEYSLAK